MSQALIQGEKSIALSKQDAMIAAETGRGLMDTLNGNTEYRFQILQKSNPTQEFAIPASAMLLVVQILTEMGQGNAVAVMPIEQKSRVQDKTSKDALEKRGLGTRIAQRFAAIGGVDLDIPTRSMARPAPTFFDGDV